MFLFPQNKIKSSAINKLENDSVIKDYLILGYFQNKKIFAVLKLNMKLLKINGFCYIVFAFCKYINFFVNSFVLSFCGCVLSIKKNTI